MPITNLSPIIPASEIDPAVATDAEYLAGDAAHANATDPHLQYPTQIRGDARYLGNDQGLVLKIRRFTGTTDATAGTANFLHGLTPAKILSLTGVIGLDGFPPGYTSALYGGSAEWNLFYTATRIYIVAGPNKNSIVNQPYKVQVIYEA